MKEEQPHIASPASSSAVENTQRYVKLTRALILKRLLAGQLDLEASQRARMESQVATIRLQLHLSEADFEQAIAQIMEKGEESKEAVSSFAATSSSSSTNQGPGEVRLAYCLSRKCRHQFSVDMSLSGFKKCPACGGPAMFMVGGEPEGST
jgi:hypothetical protein